MQTRKKAGLGQLVRERREELGLSQREVAALIGKTPSALSAIEHGRVLIPSRETRDQIGAVLRLTNVEMLVAAGEVTPEEVAGGTPWDLASLRQDDPRARLSRLALLLSPAEAETLLNVVSVWGASPGRARGEPGAD